MKYVILAVIVVVITLCVSIVAVVYFSSNHSPSARDAVHVPANVIGPRPTEEDLSNPPDYEEAY